MIQPAKTLFSRMVEGKYTVETPPNSCRIIHSLNSSFYRQNINEGYSLKYVLSGIEKYKVNKKHYTVAAGKFLMVGHNSETTVEISARLPVEGFCFFLSTDLVQDVWNALHQTADKLLEDRRSTIALPDFYENIFDGKNNALGKMVTTVVDELKSNCYPAGSFINEELFHHLAFALCKQQNQCLAHLASLKTHKKTTNEELYRRLLMARDFMHDNYTLPVSLAELAQIANISEFHFLRSFKTVFGQSPYHYLLQLRLQKAKALLKTGNQSITDVAYLCGFKEVQAFSKLFRRETGVGPGNFKQLT